MNQEPQNKTWISCAAIAAVIVAAIIGLGMPFAERLADIYFPPPTVVPNNPPTFTPVPIIPPTQGIIATSLPQATLPRPSGLCFGECWEYDDNHRTMTWTRLADGTEDIW